MDRAGPAGPGNAPSPYGDSDRWTGGERRSRPGPHPRHARRLHRAAPADPGTAGALAPPTTARASTDRLKRPEGRATRRPGPRRARRSWPPRRSDPRGLPKSPARPPPAPDWDDRADPRARTGGGPSPGGSRPSRRAGRTADRQLQRADAMRPIQRLPGQPGRERGSDPGSAAPALRPGHGLGHTPPLPRPSPASSRTSSARRGWRRKGARVRREWSSRRRRSVEACFIASATCRATASPRDHKALLSQFTQVAVEHGLRVVGEVVASSPWETRPSSRGLAPRRQPMSRSGSASLGSATSRAETKPTRPTHGPSRSSVWRAAPAPKRHGSVGAGTARRRAAAVLFERARPH